MFTHVPKRRVLATTTADGHAPSTRSLTMPELREEFARYDRDGDGAISIDEFTALLAACGEDLSADEQLLAFDATDRDADGVIDFEEFASWWTDS
jgi:calmodulin